MNTSPKTSPSSVSGLRPRWSGIVAALALVSVLLVLWLVPQARPWAAPALVLPIAMWLRAVDDAWTTRSLLRMPS